MVHVRCKLQQGLAGNHGLQFLQDPTKTQQFQQGILRLVGDELVSEFHLTRADRPDSARSQVMRMLCKPRVLFCSQKVHPLCSNSHPRCCITLFLPNSVL